MEYDNIEDAQGPHFLGYPRWHWIFSLIIGVVFFCTLMWNEGMVKTVLIYFFGAVILFWFLSCVWTLFCGSLNLIGRLLDGSRK